MFKKLKWLVIVAGAFVGLAVLAAYFSRPYLTDLALKKAGDMIGGPVTLRYAELDLLEGGVSLHGLNVFNPLRTQEILAGVREVTLSLNYRPLFKGEKATLKVTIDQPEVHYRTTQAGRWELEGKLPFLETKKGESKELPLEITQIRVQNGLLTYQDNAVGKTTRLSSLDAAFSLKPNSPFSVNFLIDGAGRLVLDGRGTFFANTLSFSASARLTNLPLLPFASYYDSPDIPVEILQGEVSLTSQAECQKNFINAPVHALVHHLNVKPKKTLLQTLDTERFLTELKNEAGDVPLEFLIQGDIRNPQFQITTNFKAAFSRAFASILIKEIPQSLEKIKEIGKEVEQTLESIQKGDIKQEVEKGLGKLKDIFGQ